MADVIAWDTAAQVGRRLARQQTTLTTYERRSLETDFEKMTAQAEELVSIETGMVSAAGPARARVADRAQWIDANVASFQRLLRPVVDKMGERLATGGRRSPVPLTLTKHVAGTELGLLLGWMSGRVLGQYDQLLIEDERPEDQDIVYYVGPNIVGVERKYGFDPSQFRLWIALHEVTHRMQFTAIPWLRPHFMGLVEKTISGLDPDPKALAAALRRSADSIRTGKNPLDEGGIASLIAGPEQLDAIRRIGGMMSLLEGHGDVTMDRAGASILPDAPRFSQTLRERRRQRGLAKAIMVLVGMDAKMKQYEQGELFIAAVERAGGRPLMDRVWEGPQNLPSLDEIREPARWVSRMTVGSAVSDSGS